MRYVKPDYFDSFRCTADKCTDTCCAGWQIVIDADTLDRYAEEKSSFRGRLMNSIDWQEGCFHQYQGRCAMLNEQNLCDLVIEKGEEGLCRTCDRYPRHEEEFEGLREWSLSLSCPVAAELILNREEPVFFLVEEDEEEDPLEDEFEDFDLLLFTQLEDARNVMFQIVQNRELPLAQRMAKVLELARRMQACMDEDRLYDMDELIAEFAGNTAQEELAQVELAEGEKEVEGKTSNIEWMSVEADEEDRYRLLKQGFGYLKKLERLREEWTSVLDETEKILYNKYEQYHQIYSDFQAEYGEGGAKQKQWEIYGEQLLMFFLFTYFCGAVYDDWIYSKAAFSVFSVTFIQEFVMCRWFLADKYIDMQDCIELAYRYAREVEHSDDNLNLLEELLQPQ